MTLQEMILTMRERGLSQGEIARLAETSQPMVYYIEHGRVPRYDIGKRIEAAYKQSMRKAKATIKKV